MQSSLILSIQFGLSVTYHMEFELEVLEVKLE